MDYKELKILHLDIETKPIKADVWGIWEQNVALNQINDDWGVISWAAKWDGPSRKVFQMDRRKLSERKLLLAIRDLLDRADLVVAHNGKAFDSRKLNARFIINRIKPPQPYKQVDTLQEARKHFAFTSNKLEYLADKLNKKYKKLKHTKYPGHTLWTEVMKGNKDAWKHMAKYNIHDVYSLEEVYHRMLPWITLPKIREIKK